MTQLRPDDVRRVAEAAGLHEIYCNQTSCVISFAPDEDDFSALSRINVYYSTGTVATSLEDPRQGKTLLFRRDVDIPLLRELMREPRLHTSKGDHQRNVRPRREPCVVCLDKQSHVTLVCGHTALCNGCADQLPRGFDGLVTCPLCRARSGLSIIKGSPGNEEAEALAQVAVLRAQAATAEIAEQIEAAEGVIVACRKRREDEMRREAEQQRERRADELAGYRATLGDTHPDTLESINDLGVLLLDQDDLAAAEPLLREAVAGCRATLGNTHQDTLTSINDLGALLRAQGDLAAAEPLLREVVAGRRATLGGTHPDTLKTINDLGVLLQAQDDMAAAEPLLREAVAGYCETLGETHPDTLTSINNLGVLLQAQDDPAAAEPLLRDALAGRRATLGDTHPDTLESINNLGVLLLDQDDLAAAEPLLREAVAGCRATLGDTHPHTLKSIMSLGALLRAQGDLAAAEPLLREALAGYREITDLDSMDAAESADGQP